ncbi:MAG: ATP-binding cassette domain-containing protein [Nitriliruptor sp.]|nr:MAG: ATP-binding cassette domain-containing protein [Nitriliruptor sp.]
MHTFGKDIRALDGVSLAFDAGMVYGLLGPNGAGKTTLIRVLATLLRPDSGSVRVAGVDVLEHPTRARTRIGLAGQFAAVDDYLTGRENVRMIGRLYGLSAADAKRRADEILESIGLTDAAVRAVRTYSGGMRRRLDLAASLVGRPQVLFLDEPTTGIDPRNRADLWTLIRQLVDDGTTVLLTTQYLEEADQLAERIGVIDHGRIISEGTSDELKDTLGGAMLELSVATEHREAAQRVLTEALGDAPTLDPDTDRYRVTAPDGTATLLAAVRALDRAGIEPDDVRLIKPTLDDVFLQLTDTEMQPEVAS